MPSTAACFSRSAQICCRVVTSTHSPSHFMHSSRLLLPIITTFISAWQRGQSCFASATSVRAARAPQWEQNFAPTNISPKQEGQAAVARCTPQYAHFVASLATAAPHEGQWSTSADIIPIIAKRHNEQSYLRVQPSQPYPPQPQRIGNHRYRAKAHGGSGKHGVQQQPEKRIEHAGGHRHAQQIV